MCTSRLLNTWTIFLAVILSDYYYLPFNDILDWKKFSVIVREKDVYQLKQILKNITQEEFVALHNNLVKVGALSTRTMVSMLVLDYWRGLNVEAPLLLSSKFSCQWCLGGF